MSILALSALASMSWAAQVQVSVQPRDLLVDQTARMRISVVNGQLARLPQLPVSAGVEIVYNGQAQSVRSDFSGVTRVIAYDFSVHALQPGTVTLGPYDLQIGPDVVKTQPVELVVRPRPEPGGAESFEVSAGFDTARAWEGQVVLYHYKVLSRVPIVDTPSWTFPQFDGFRVPRDGDQPHRSYTVDDPDGAIRVNEGYLPLVATGTGTRDQPPVVVRLRQAVDDGRRRGPFARLFQSYKQVTLAGQEARLTVSLLPSAPPGFTGLVGEFSFSSALDKRTLRVGESADWVVRVSGSGSLEGWALPPLDVPGIKVYDAGSSAVASVQNGRYRSSGTLDRVLVATAEGTVEVPPITLVTFSPRSGDFVSHELSLPTIEVVPGGEASANVESFTQRGPSAVIAAPEVYDLKPIWTWGPAHTPYLGAALPWLFGLAALPGLGVLGLESGAAARRRARRWRAARKTPPKASRLLCNLPQEPEARLAQLDAALRLALANHSGVTVGVLDRDLALAELPDDLAASVRELGARLDRARFAGQPADLEDALVEMVRALEAL